MTKQEEILSCQLLELVTPSLTLPNLLDKHIKLWTDPSPDLTQRCNSPQRAPLQLGSPLEILLDSIFGDSRSLHRFLELRGGFVEALGDRGRCNLGEAEEHHMRDDSDFVRIVRETGEDAAEEDV